MSVSKWILKLMRDQGKHRWIAISVVVFCFVAVAVISPLTWSAIVTTAAKAGNSHWIAMSYPFTFDGLGLTGALMLLEDLRNGRGFSRWPSESPCRAQS